MEFSLLEESQFIFISFSSQHGFKVFELLELESLWLALLEATLDLFSFDEQVFLLRNE